MIEKDDLWFKQYAYFSAAFAKAMRETFEQYSVEFPNDIKTPFHPSAIGSAMHTALEGLAEAVKAVTDKDIEGPLFTGFFEQHLHCMGVHVDSLQDMMLEAITLDQKDKPN